MSRYIPQITNQHAHRKILDTTGPTAEEQIAALRKELGIANEALIALTEPATHTEQLINRLFALTCSARIQKLLK